MKHRHHSSSQSAQRTDVKKYSRQAGFPSAPGWKRWCFRLVSLIGAPILAFLILELCLRVGHFGYCTSFLLQGSNQRQGTLVQNNCFGWRFFGPRMARLPCSISITQSRKAGTIRIFVFGESAAFGDPQPDFGLARMLKVILELRYPGVRFEVVNAAMTAINSHVVLPIAHDCSKAGGDIWVVYMGNNEVVGPFGAGTIFGSQTPPLPLIRASIALQSTRIGQLLDQASQQMRKSAFDFNDWGGMEMFLSQQVRSDDPRMRKVYQHFERNLSDILQTGRDAGVGMVISTVAVNLKDCPPFASKNRSDLQASDKEQFLQFYQLGAQAQASGRSLEAVKYFGKAARIDNSFAELRFRMGKCALAMGAISTAQKEFAAARDLDTLRFRCDSHLNALIRRTASRRENERIRLADAELAFAEQSPDELPGENLFYEHVHLNLHGNYLLAKTIAPRIGELLPAEIQKRATPNLRWPSEADCAGRLGWSSWYLFQALSEIHTRMTHPPFSSELDHETQLTHVKSLIVDLLPATQASGLQAALNICEQAVLGAPNDPILHEQLSLLRLQTGDRAGGLSEARSAVELLPSNSEYWGRLGVILAAQKRFEDAVDAFQQARALDPQNDWILRNLGLSEAMLGHYDLAIRDYRDVLKLNPRCGLAWMGLGSVFELAGNELEMQECYQKALANRIYRTQDLMILARFCRDHGWLEAAATNYLDAAKLAPWNQALQREAVDNLLVYGDNLSQKGRSNQAALQFRQAVQLSPELTEPRLRLATTLANLGLRAEALAQFQEVLKRAPTNTSALENFNALRASIDVH